MTLVDRKPQLTPRSELRKDENRLFRSWQVVCADERFPGNWGVNRIAPVPTKTSRGVRISQRAAEAGLYGGEQEAVVVHNLNVISELNLEGIPK